ncbi:hypothetical protein G6F65_019493 [Rhizopus arrhizus]|nr:hypothetical protein G6F65_019493 [Rhizopus arrhizus]
MHPLPLRQRASVQVAVRARWAGVGDRRARKADAGRAGHRGRRDGGGAGRLERTVRRFRVVLPEAAADAGGAACVRGHAARVSRGRSADQRSAPTGTGHSWMAPGYGTCNTGPNNATHSCRCTSTGASSATTPITRSRSGSATAIARISLAVHAWSASRSNPRCCCRASQSASSTRPRSMPLCR